MENAIHEEGDVVSFARVKKSKVTMKEGVAEERGKNGRYHCAYTGCPEIFPSHSAMMDHVYEKHRKGEKP